MSSDLCRCLKTKEGASPAKHFILKLKWCEDGSVHLYSWCHTKRRLVWARVSQAYSLESNYMQLFFVNIFATVHRINLGFSPLLSEFEMWHFYAAKCTVQWDKFAYNYFPDCTFGMTMTKILRPVLAWHGSLIIKQGLIIRNGQNGKGPENILFLLDI